MAIEKTYLLGKNITLGCGFDLQAKAPLDSRQVVPEYAGLQALIDGNAAYEGMIVYDEGTKKTYQAQIVDGVLAFREFGINEAELKALIASETTAAMEFKGAATALPENPAKGDFYKVTASFEVDGDTAKVGDSIVYDGEQWFLIPSGDDIEDTWRPVTDVDNDATLTFAAGDKLDVAVASNGTVTYSHEAIDAPVDVTEEGDERTRTYITAVETDGFGHITGYKTATENVEDTNTTYTFEGQGEDATSVYFQVTSSEEGASAEVIYLDAYSKNEADGKFVAKETGKSLISDDEIARLAEVDNYNDTEVRGLIGDNTEAIEALEDYVGTIPADEKYADITNVISYVNKKAEETLAAAQGGSSETAASVKQQLDNYKSENDTRVKAVEDAVGAINNTENGILKQAKDYADGLAGNYDAKGAADGVKTELSTEIAKKVDKVEGKSLIADTEIARLANITNYDDTVIKADIAKKADAETMTTELGKKVDKVDGYSLVSDTEIARLKDVDNYDDTAIKADIAKKADSATMTTELGKKVDKVTGYSLVSDAEIARLADVDNYDDKEVRGLIGDNADAIAEIVGDYVKSADIANFETKENVKKVSDNLAAYIESNNTAIADRYTKAEADGKFALIADAYDDEEVRGLISANAKAIADEESRAKGVEEGLQTQINTIMSNPDAEGAINSINEFTQYVKDHGTIAEGFRTDIDKNKEDIAAVAKSIADQATADEAKYETKTDASAKLAEAKGYTDTEVAKDRARLDTLEAIDHDAYVDADATLKAELQAEIDADVKVVSDALATARTEISAEIDADVKALADGQVTTNKNDIASLLAQMTWGEF